jgi:hypothetical protein
MTRLVVGTHNHLPLGQDMEASERAYQEAFKPLLTIAYQHPDFPLVLHYSGTLMEWLEEVHPEFLTLLAEMVGRGQVEMLGGGYYDPILPLIPTNDKLGQLEKMTTWLRVRFESRPRGCWLAEKVWEPGLASVLKASGIDFTFLDDAQFRMAGASGPALLRPAIVEDQGKIIAVLPVSTRLSKLAAAGSPEEAVRFIEGASAGETEAGNPGVAVLLDDGAASGLLREGWLERFILLAEGARDRILPTLSGQFLKERPATQRLHIPSCSSLDMMRWALHPSRRGAFSDLHRQGDAAAGAGQFVVGGHFRHFLTRYPEAWLMYAKMMNTHVLVNQVRGDKYKKKSAQNELWKGQSHHAYWHGERGGIYRNSLRKAVYHSLIEAEKITRATEIFAPSIISVDFDMDNATEYLYQGSEINAYIHSIGGALFELDFLPASWNYLDTMIDRDAPNQSEAGQAASLPRKAFIDHFIGPGSTVSELGAGAFEEAGDFAAQPYELVELNRALPELLMRRVGSVGGKGTAHPVGIDKRFVFRPRSIDVYYRISNLGETDLDATFGVEINVSLAGRSAESGRLFLLDEDRTMEIDAAATEIDGVHGLLVRDVQNEVSVTLSSAKQFQFWSAPVETPPEGPVDGPRVFQSQCFLPHWSLRLARGETWENHMSVGFEKIQGSA